MFDAQKSLHAKVFAQNFLKDARVARELIGRANIGKEDTVLEIGPGEGIITKELAAVASKVISVEADARLAEVTRKKFKDTANVEIVSADFLKYEIKEKEYVVFSNIPFNITNQIVKKLLGAANSPRDTWLFAQREAAERLCGLPREQEFSILSKPWFSYGIVHEFKKTDFVPVPNVDVVLLHIHKREQELLRSSERGTYTKFVQYAYRQQKKDLEANFQKIFTYKQWKRLAKDLKFSAQATVTDLAVEQWVDLYHFFTAHVEVFKQRLIG